MPRISIVMPAYNAEPYLARTLEGVRAQTLPDWELVLVDNASTDGTGRIARDYAARDSRIRVHAQHPNVGGAGARNVALAATDPSSDYVIALDADDVWEPDALEALAAALDAAPGAVAAHGLARYIDAEDRPFGDLHLVGKERRKVVGRRLVTVAPDAPTTFAVVAYANPVRTGGQILFRRSTLAAVGPFDAASIADDWDMALRVSRLGELAFVGQVVLRYRWHGGNLSRQNRAMYRSQVRIHRRMLLDPGNTPEQREIARWARWHLCQQQLRWMRGDLAHGHLGQAGRHLQHCLRMYAHFAYDLMRLYGGPSRAGWLASGAPGGSGRGTGTEKTRP